MAEFQPLTVTNEREVSAEDLTIDQLASLKQQHEDEIKELSSQLDQLHGAKSRYINSKNVIDDMSKSTEGSTLLVPLTSSLYAPGIVQTPQKVIVELGTGYFVEKTVNDAKELITRKITLIDKSIESVEKVGLGKKKTLEQINMLINYKIMMAQELKKQQSASTK